METSLATLKQEGLLRQWSDAQILPGQNISSVVRQQMEQADIIVFLFSPDFIASAECKNEWDYAQALAASGKALIRIPIIVRECSWRDILQDDDVKALPNDGKAVVSYSDTDLAWHEVYEGIKLVVQQLKSTFQPKDGFLQTIEGTDFISQDHLKLQDLFVFLRLRHLDSRSLDQSQQDQIVSNLEQLLSINHALVFGQEKTGKTALARYVYLSLVEQGKPVLLLDSAYTDRAPSNRTLQEAYQEQFYGDFSLWVKQPHKTLILDNFNIDRYSLDFVEFAKSVFDNVLIVVDLDRFFAFFMDEARLAEFRQLMIEPLTRQQQEQLIRRRLALSSSTFSDGAVDRVERRVNAVIVSNRVVPRFPFYVLSIMQTYEAYMPNNMSITSYGHCYYVLIVASLVRAGISKTDDAINPCFNFAEYLAFDIYEKHEGHPDEPYDFDAYVEQYQERFIIPQSTINRLKNATYGIIGDDGLFRTSYMYYYFLGRFLANNPKVGDPIVRAMCEATHREINYLTLLFTIHHTTGSTIIDDILLQTICTLDSVKPATLNPEETKGFNSIVFALPENILSSGSVAEARAMDRMKQDEIEGTQVIAEKVMEEMPEQSPVNEIYRILKNNKVMGQILRNKYGNFERTRVQEIIDIIIDGGLRLVNYILGSEEEITELAQFVMAQHPDWDLIKIKRGVGAFSFLWTMVNIEQIVSAINVPAIGEAVDAVVSKKATPAYDLVGYFTQLDNADELTDAERNRLADLLKRHDDIFIKHVLSRATQRYMNTHRSKAMTEQAVCSLLGIQYRPRMIQGR